MGQVTSKDSSDNFSSAVVLTDPNLFNLNKIIIKQPDSVRHKSSPKSSTPSLIYIENQNQFLDISASSNGINDLCSFKQNYDTADYKFPFLLQIASDSKILFIFESSANYINSLSNPTQISSHLAETGNTEVPIQKSGPEPVEGFCFETESELYSCHSTKKSECDTDNSGNHSLQNVAPQENVHGSKQCAKELIKPEDPGIMAFNNLCFVRGKSEAEISRKLSLLETANYLDEDIYMVGDVYREATSVNNTSQIINFKDFSEVSSSTENNRPPQDLNASFKFSLFYEPPQGSSGKFLYFVYSYNSAIHGFQELARFGVWFDLPPEGFIDYSQDFNLIHLFDIHESFSDKSLGDLQFKKRNPSRNSNDMSLSKSNSNQNINRKPEKAIHHQSKMFQNMTSSDAANTIKHQDVWAESNDDSLKKDFNFVPISLLTNYPNSYYSSENETSRGFFLLDSSEIPDEATLFLLKNLLKVLIKKCELVDLSFQNSIRTKSEFLLSLNTFIHTSSSNYSTCLQFTIIFDYFSNQLKRSLEFDNSQLQCFKTYIAKPLKSFYNKINLKYFSLKKKEVEEKTKGVHISFSKNDFLKKEIQDPNCKDILKIDSAKISQKKYLLLFLFSSLSNNQKPFLIQKSLSIFQFDYLNSIDVLFNKHFVKEIVLSFCYFLLETFLQVLKLLRGFDTLLPPIRKYLESQKHLITNFTSQVQNFLQRWDFYQEVRLTQKKRLECCLERKGLEKVISDICSEKFSALSVAKEGILWFYILSENSAWRKSSAILKDGYLTCIPISHNSTKQGFDLRNLTVKPSSFNNDRRFCFELKDEKQLKVLFQASNEQDKNSWITAIQFWSKNHNIHPLVDPKYHSVRDSSISLRQSHTFMGLPEEFPNKTGYQTTKNLTKSAETTKSIEINYLEVVREIDSSNYLCCDCLSSKAVEWISVNMLIVLCIDCAGVHRSLGTHISKIRSLTLDVSIFTREMTKLLSSVSNAVANSYWEFNLLNKTKLISADSSTAQRSIFITNKYKHKQYIEHDIKVHNHLIYGIHSNNIQMILRALANNGNPNMVVIKGKNQEVESTLLEYSLTHFSEADSCPIFEIAELLILNGALVGEKISNRMNLLKEAKDYWQSKIDRSIGMSKERN
ncbi:ArfGap-domain-containing protein [Ascoidea rubescens DSM 1968]|uniref:ADP-ribosylation factor GTPase-activating protein n=1 Tax=Ascoidea rubescens DSM 1968 TaxID=1344418 RepID=A0A1D2V8P4_9ASCO|nr:ArfGap-domain-containing protein [Ascoidea rubescens DSM 1968]ODV57994.1 ArfGap-domain-containing protein [Ascoidea rubescens DSM 1968]